MPTTRPKVELRLSAWMLSASVLPHDRKLPKRRIDYSLVQGRVVGQDNAEDRDCQEEQREHRHQHHVGQLDGEIAPVIIAVLFS